MLSERSVLSTMGKDLKGRELGKGISQRKDGYYSARFTTRTGDRKQKYFHKLQECKHWLAEAEEQDQLSGTLDFMDITVDTWFDYWMNDIKAHNIRPSTADTYHKNYKLHIKPVIGHLLVTDVKPIHCQRILNQMSNKGIKNSYIGVIRCLVSSIFSAAVDNQIIKTSPVNRTVKCNTGKESEPKHALSVTEQIKLLSSIKKSQYALPVRFILQTGLRVGELTALTWSDIDYKNNCIYVNKTFKFLSEKDPWLPGPPKTKSGTRTIPLTAEAKVILEEQKKRPKVKEQYGDVIFTNRVGNPICGIMFNQVLARYCNKCQIPHISVHGLRHTYATRCIEAGMKPKTLQKILGHSTLAMTMDLYVHATDEELNKEMLKVEEYLKVV